MKPNRVDAAAIAILLLILGGAYLAVIRPGNRAAAYLQRQTNALRETTRSVPALERQVQSARLSLGPERDEQEAVAARLSKRQEIEKFIQEVATGAQTEQIQLQLIKPGPIRKATFASIAPVTVTATGTFDRVFRFLQRIEELPRVACVDEWSIENDLALQRGGALCRVELKLALYLKNPE